MLDVILPHTFESVSGSVSVHSETIEFIVCKLSFEYIAVRVRVLAMTVEYIIFEIALVDTAICKR